MDRMTKDQKDKVVATLESAEKLIQGGTEPAAAFAKAAMANQLPPEFVKRAVEAGNVRRSLEHFSKSAGADRSSSFPLPHPDKVVDLMYAPLEKAAKASVSPAAAFSSLDGLFTPEYSEGEVKAASLTRETGKQPSMDHLLKQAYIHLGELEKNQETLNAGRVAVTGMIRESFEKLAARVRNNLGAFAEMERNARGSIGDTALPIVEGLQHRLQEIGIKVARFQGEITPRVVAKGSMADDLCGIITLANQVASFEKAAEAVSKIRDGFSVFVADHTVKAAGAISDIMESKVKSTVGLEDEEAPQGDDYSDISMTARSEQDGIQSQLTVMKLLQDPVLRRKPADAVSAFNTLAASFPELAKNEMTALPYVRKAVESGGPELMDLTSAAQVQKAMKGRPEAQE